MERKQHLDSLRGIVMILMTIDHARDYAGTPGFPPDPMDLHAIGPGLFFIRWVTHFCAPAFALLMGSSTYLSSLRRTPDQLTWHLLRRGLILLLLEFTLVDWAWSWNPFWPRKFFQVIGALACALLLLAFATRLPRKIVLTIGVAIVALHNLADGIHFDPTSWAHVVWSFVHQRNVIPLLAGYEVRTSYPFLPIAGIALIGFGLGDAIAEGKAWLRWLGVGTMALFVVLRTVVGYGDLHAYAPETGRFLSLLNVTKYPLSLHFVCMTLGPVFVFLGCVRHVAGAFAWVSQLGRVPLFYYVAHLWTLHALALSAALVVGFPLASFDLRSHFGGRPEGFGFHYFLSIPLAAMAIILCYPLGRWWEKRGTGVKVSPRPV
jgi:uncharacterized membrane protein